MPDMTESEMRERAFDVALEENRRAELIRKLTRKNKDYVTAIPITNLDVYISAVEHTLELANIPYGRRQIRETDSERKVKTKYLTDLLVKAELAGIEDSF